ncbi:unnamed protein product [Durusdinium trenchii]|uniref:Uncharacterized protein n=1 Tax=Durusdinium trenchii TaxID=1381693 RepID=A0ABP0NEZ6_9DINO
MDGVAEIYKQSDDKVKSDVKSILDGRDSCALWLPLIKSIQGTHGTALHMNEMKELQSEDYRKDSAFSVAILTASDLIMSPEKYQKEDPKSSHAAAIQYGASLGISRQDLPAKLREKLDELLGREKPAQKSQTENNKGAKRKATEKKGDKAKKPRGAAESTRKRKQDK